MHQPSMRLPLLFALALSACGSGAGTGNVQAANATGAAANQAAVQFSGPAPAAGVTREFLIGSWAVDTCDVPAAVYGADGTTDGGRGRWTLDGDRLIVTRGTTREQSVIERLGDDRMRLNTSAGPFELHRCPAAHR